MPNAIILAAGKSKRFAPFTYEKPKGLFCVKGEILVERQIRQLREAGIREIYLVVGFMKEKYFYLEQKYGVKFLVNNTFEHKGNLYSLYVARHYLEDSFICCADHYFLENPFVEELKHSYRSCIRQEKREQKFSIKLSDEDVITQLVVGGESEFVMAGEAFFTKKFSSRLVDLMEREIGDFGVDNLFWEEFYGKHMDEITLYAKVRPFHFVEEFDSVEQLREFDEEFLKNIDSDIVLHICDTLDCKPDEISNIDVIDKGLTNVSFRFVVKGNRYVYRHPGNTANNLVDRQSEIIAQLMAKKLGIDTSIIHMDLSGWKLSHYIEHSIGFNLDIEENLLLAMKYLRCLHTQKCKDRGVREFRPYSEALKLMEIASLTKGNLMKEFEKLVYKVGKINQYLESEFPEKVLCHNDVYAPNFLLSNDQKLYLIDWEYAGLNDPAYDVACILCRGTYTDQQIIKYVEAYTGHPVTEREKRHYFASIALCGFYWFCWGLYKGAVNDDDGFFMIPAYQNCERFVELSLLLER